MTTLSAFRDRHDLDEDWSVRFTADESRAREMGETYRGMGLDVRVLPLAGEDGEIQVGPDAAATPNEAADDSNRGHDPIRRLDGDACTTCLGEETYVVVTRRTDEEEEADEGAGQRPDLVY